MGPGAIGPQCSHAGRGGARKKAAREIEDAVEMRAVPKSRPSPLLRRDRSSRVFGELRLKCGQLS